MTRMHLLIILFLLLTSAVAAPAIAQEKLNLEGAAALLDDEPASAEPSTAPVDFAADKPDATESETPPKSPVSFIGLLRASGSVGLVICLLSLAGVALVIEHLLTIRRSVLIPPGLPDELLALLNAGQWSQARQKALESESMLGQGVAGGISECELGWAAVEVGAEEAIGEQAAKLYRKVEYLNLIGNLAPMLGLLGTVVGMVVAFRELADTQGFARATDLAQGIYLALVTTVEGLVVAIPALALYSVFVNRVASLTSETTFLVGQVLLPIKKRLIAAAQPTVSQPTISQTPVPQQGILPSPRPIRRTTAAPSPQPQPPPPGSPPAGT